MALARCNYTGVEANERETKNAIEVTIRVLEFGRVGCAEKLAVAGQAPLRLPYGQIHSGKAIVVKTQDVSTKVTGVDFY